MEETTSELSTRTKVVANPIATPFIMALVTAKVGHIPRSWRKTGFSFHSPLVKSSLMVLLGIFSLNLELAAFLEFSGLLEAAIDSVEDCF